MAETPVVMKSLLVEHLMTELTWDPCSDRVTTLMVDQTCLVQSLEGAARMITVWSLLRVNEPLFTALLLLIFSSPKMIRRQRIM